MIVSEDRKQTGCRDAVQAFSSFVDGIEQLTTADRVSYLCGMQSFCREQLKQELSAAMDELENGVERHFAFPADEHAISATPA